MRAASSALVHEIALRTDFEAARRSQKDVREKAKISGLGARRTKVFLDLLCPGPAETPRRPQECHDAFAVQEQQCGDVCRGSGRNFEN